MGRRIQIAASVVAFLAGLTVLFGRLLLDFEAYVSELESHALARAVAGEVRARPPMLREHQSRATAAALLASGVDAGDAALIWAVWDLEGDDGATRFRRDLERVAEADGWLASFIVWLNESRIDDVRQIRLDESRALATPTLSGLDPHQTEVVQLLWNQNGSDLLSSLLDIANRMGRALAEEVLLETEDRVRSSLRADLLPTEDDMRDWIDSRAASSDCSLSYVPSADYYQAELHADCPGGDEVVRTISLPRFD